MNYKGPGKYEHYKGGHYKILGLARNESFLDDAWVLYQLYNTKSKDEYYIRSIKDFNKDVERFKKIT